jgi:hypothetical protein
VNHTHQALTLPDPVRIGWALALLVLLGAGRWGRAAGPVVPEVAATVQRFRLQGAPQEPSEFVPDALAGLAAGLTWDVGQGRWRFGPRVEVAAPFGALYTQAALATECVGIFCDRYRLWQLGLGAQAVWSGEREGAHPVVGVAGDLTWARLTILGYWCEGDACGDEEELRANGRGVSLSPWVGVEVNRPGGWRLSVAGTAELSVGAPGQWLAWGGRVAVAPVRERRSAGPDLRARRPD